MAIFPKEFPNQDLSPLVLQHLNTPVMANLALVNKENFDLMVEKIKTISASKNIDAHVAQAAPRKLSTVKLLYEIVEDRLKSFNQKDERCSLDVYVSLSKIYELQKGNKKQLKELITKIIDINDRYALAFSLDVRIYCIARKAVKSLRKMGDSYGNSCIEKTIIKFCEAVGNLQTLPGGSITRFRTELPQKIRIKILSQAKKALTLYKPPAKNSKTHEFIDLIVKISCADFYQSPLKERTSALFEIACNTLLFEKADEQFWYFTRNLEKLDRSLFHTISSNKFSDIFQKIWDLYADDSSHERLGSALCCILRPYPRPAPILAPPIPNTPAITAPVYNKPHACAANKPTNTPKRTPLKLPHNAPPGILSSAYRAQEAMNENEKEAINRSLKNRRFLAFVETVAQAVKDPNRKDFLLRFITEFSPAH